MFLFGSHPLQHTPYITGEIRQFKEETTNLTDGDNDENVFSAISNVSSIVLFWLEGQIAACQEKQFSTNMPGKWPQRGIGITPVTYQSRAKPNCANSAMYSYWSRFQHRQFFTLFCDLSIIF